MGDHLIVLFTLKNDMKSRLKFFQLLCDTTQEHSIMFFWHLESISSAINRIIDSTNKKNQYNIGLLGAIWQNDKASNMTKFWTKFCFEQILRHSQNELS